MTQRLLAIAAFIMAPGIAHASSCRGYDIAALQSGLEAYNPAGIGAIRVQLTLTVPHDRPDSSCAAVPITITPRDGSRMVFAHSGNVLHDDIFRDSSVGTGSLASYELIGTGRARLIGQGRLTFDMLRIEPGQFVSPGDYTVNINVVVGDRPAVPVQLVVHVDPAIRFVGDAASGLKTMSLGDLDRGADVTSTFFFRTNAPITVKAVSEHGGRLQHELGSSYGQIPYKAYYSGRLLNLESEQAIPIQRGPAMLQQGSLRVVVAPQHNRFGGVYRDVLTLNFTAF